MYEFQTSCWVSIYTEIEENVKYQNKHNIYNLVKNSLGSYELLL